MEVLSANAISVIFAWSKVECDKINGALLGYECTVYFDTYTHTESVVASISSYIVSVPAFQSVPRAFSVAAVNEVGIGDHCPPVNLPNIGLILMEFNI